MAGVPRQSRDVGARLTPPVAWVRGALRDVVDLAWPSNCLGCGAWGPSWCATCDAGLCCEAFTVRAHHAPELDVAVAAAFDGPLREAITAFKDRGRSDGLDVLVRLARRSLARALTDATLEDAALGTGPSAGAGPLVLVPIPSRAAAYRERGRFPLGELCDAVCRGTSLVSGRSLLRHRDRGVADQARLTLAERRRNVEGAFRIEPRTAERLVRAGARVVLFDDVVTSGATLAAAHATLQRAGVRVVAVAALAATPHEPNARSAG